MELNKKVKNSLVDYLNGIDNLVLAFLFGSRIKGNAHQESDIDIAILFEKNPVYEDIMEIKDKISEITSMEADIVNLNDSSPIIRMKVLQNGIQLVNKNPVSFNVFFVKTIKEYEDIKHIRKEIEKNILDGKIYD